LATKVREAAGAVERILLPRLNSIDGDLKSIHTEIGAVNTRVDEMDKRINTKFDSIEGQIQSVRNEVRTEITALKNEISSAKNQLQTEIGSMKNELRTEIGSVQSELRSGFGAVHAELHRLADKVDLVKEMEKLKLDVAELKRRG
jgi:uncharacterized protein YicC (UPF0701 family)